MAVDAKPIGGVTPSAVIEADFAGDQPSSSTGGSERSYYDSPSLRLRHGYMKLINDYVNVLIGQTDDVFGWQNTPSSVSRHTQFRPPARSWRRHPWVSTSLRSGAPGQRDSRCRRPAACITGNRWKGITRDGIPTTRKLSLGVSGVAQQLTSTRSPAGDPNVEQGGGLGSPATRCCR
jgi:hypothetical protein